MSSEDEMDVEELKEELEEKGIDHQDVVTKYTSAADIANQTVQLLLSRLVAGVRIVELCAAADAHILEATGKIYNKGKVEKGIAFPTCLSVNNVVGHFSPLVDDATVLAEGDLVKIDCGVHIDGYIAVVGHTAVVGRGGLLEGRAADVTAAAFTAAECAQRMLKPGVKNSDITAMLNKVATIFNCNVVQAVLSHQMKRFVIDGNNVIISKSDADTKVHEVEFQVGEVYAMDVVVSTGEGKPKEVDERTTVYKRAVDQTYQLKMKASRQVLSEINNRFPTFPFTIRSLEDVRGKLGMVELLKHDMVVPYPVLYEKPGEFTAQFKFTVLIMPSGTLRITGAPVNMASIQTQFKIEDPELLALLAQDPSAGKKKKDKKKKKKKSASSSSAVADEDDEDME